MTNQNNNSRLIAADTGALLIAWLLALITRYGNLFAIERWQKNMYLTDVAVTVLIYLFMSFRKNGKGKALTQQDVVDILVSVVRSGISILAALLFFLVLTGNVGRHSRLVLGALGLYYVIADFIARFVLRRFLVRAKVKEENSRSVLLVTLKAFEKLAARRFATEVRENKTADGIIYLDEEVKEIPGRFDEAYIYAPETDGAVKERLDRVITFLEEAGTAASRFLTIDGRDVHRDLIGEAGSYASVKIPSLQKRCDILGVHFNVSDVASAAAFVTGHINALRGEYITFCNVHTTVMASDDSRYKDVQNGAVFTFADGAPIAKVERLRGFSAAKRVAGPDFMDQVMRDTMTGEISHYFYGSTPETLKKLEENLVRKYPGIVIKGTFSPPFRPLEAITKEEDEEDIRRINESGADMIWIGLGAPKQENWMAMHRGKLNGVMVGVGAGFDFYAGTIKRAPKWIQKIGMEWLYRLFQDPKRLLKRYLVTNIKFLWYVLTKR